MYDFQKKCPSEQSNSFEYHVYLCIFQKIVTLYNFNIIKNSSDESSIDIL